MFPKREERVPYGGGKPVRSGRSNRNSGGNRQSRKEKQNEPQRRRVRKGGRKLNRNMLYLRCLALGWSEVEAWQYALEKFPTGGNLSDIKWR